MYIVCFLVVTLIEKNEFYGDIIFENVVKRKIFGQWHESFLCGTDNTAKTIWRMGAMPEDFNLYYGFTRFAIELNEITDDIKDDLPPTDTRFSKLINKNINQILVI